MEGPDHVASIDPTELKALVDGIRAIELSLGDGIKRIQSVEKGTQKVVQKGIYTTQNLKAGTVITEEMLVGKRPVVELSIDEYEKLIGKKIVTDLSKNQAIKLSDIDFN
jgi:N,N'-diacetyllegionaminate synthase